MSRPDVVIRPHPAVPPGARVAVVAPSSPIKPELLAAGLAEVRSLGYEPVVDDDIAARHRFHAGTDSRRLDELARALADDSVRAVWLARGGYGLTPLLRELDASTFARAPKVIIGESDATALGCWALQAGVTWIHGPMVAGSLRLGDDGRDVESLRSALAGRPATVSAGRVVVPGRARGRLWGGCLTLLASLAGTPWLPRIDDGILVIEDVGVKPYQVHRMLVQLRDVGALDGLRGVVLGDFSDCVQHAEQGYGMDEVFADFFQESAGGAVPIVADWPIGHADASHLSLVMGAPVELRATDEQSSLGWSAPFWEDRAC